MTPAPHPTDNARKRPELWLAAAAFVAIFATSLSANPSLAAFAAASIVWMGSSALLFGGWNAFRRIRGEPVRGIPATERYVPAHVQWKVFLALGVIFFGLREGALAPDFVLNFHQYSAKHHIQTDTSSSVNGMNMGDAPELRFAGRALRLSYQTCHGDAVVCRGFERALPPTQREGEDLASIAPVSLQVTVNSSTTCMMPITKSGTFDVTVMADAHLDSHPGKDLLKDGNVNGDIPPIATKSLSVNATLNLRHEMLGPVSCRVFKLTAGERLARSLAGTLEQTLAKH
jgi:hypothetical protein